MNTDTTDLPVIRLTRSQCGAILAWNGSVSLRPQLSAAGHRLGMEEGLLRITVRSWTRPGVDYWVSINGPRTSCSCPDWLRNRKVPGRGAQRPIYWCKHLHAVAVALAERAVEERGGTRTSGPVPAPLPPETAWARPCPGCGGWARLMGWGRAFGYACLREGCGFWLPLREEGAPG